MNCGNAFTKVHLKVCPAKETNLVFVKVEDTLGDFVNQKGLSQL